MAERAGARVLRSLPSRPPLGGGARTAPREPAELLAAAAAAAQEWWRLAPVARGRALAALAAEVEGRRGPFVSELRRSGRPLSAALGEVEAAVDRLVWWAGWSDKLDLLPAPVTSRGRVVERSAGVVLTLAPTTHVLLGAVSVLAPVLVAGGACVLVPGPGGTGAALQLADASVVAGIPVGLVTVPQGSGAGRLGVLDRLAPGVDAVDARGGAGLEEGALRALRVAAAEHDRVVLAPLAGEVPGLAEGSAPDPGWLFPLRRSSTVRS
ncbi:aldehyde dehydrogenase (NAD+) [Kineococcus xinjiangensis]|uniref:Aldehyde dehydrogenase (NAD+) n=1 Tax=Kineococcus xinjiangensis TaxID=512762 RepID=A0A2S6ITV8_9ACTN|nr:aldehyde dehydrogenase family protein [Kineococcus xinjiangensis]PPK97682.1 aldehyde dehydrogenase (NAD+) [Kineococcus xinjiangensis]